MKDKLRYFLINEWKYIENNYFCAKFLKKGFMAQRKSKQNTSGGDIVVDVVEVKGSEVSIGNILEKNEKIISYVLLGIGILVALFFMYKFLYLTPKEKEAANAIYKAEEAFAKDSFALALDGPAGGYDGFLAIIDNYSGTKTANLATYYAGVSYLNLGRFDEAIEYLEKYSAKDDVTAISKSGALADAYAETGNMDKAKGLYKKASDSKNEFLSSYFTYKLAVLHQSEGNIEEAVKLLKKIVDNYPTSNEYANAEKLLARLQ